MAEDFSISMRAITASGARNRDRITKANATEPRLGFSRHESQ